MYRNFLPFLLHLFCHSQTIHFCDSLLEGRADFWLLSVVTLPKLLEIRLIIWVEKKLVCLFSCTILPPQTIQTVYLGIKIRALLLKYALTLFCLGVINPRNKICALWDIFPSHKTTTLQNIRQIFLAFSRCSHHCPC